MSKVSTKTKLVVVVHATHYCNVCGRGIKLGDDIHSDEEGEDCHSQCCPICLEEEMTSSLLDSRISYREGYEYNSHQEFDDQLNHYSIGEYREKF